jgi:type II secretory pathway pseudopilin PulG
MGYSEYVKTIIQRSQRGAKRLPRAAGITVVELVIALGVLAVALLALVSVISSASALQKSSREKSLAYNAARLKIEEMRSRPFANIYSLYKSGTSGNTFSVDGLVPINSTTPVGLITFPEQSGALYENFPDPTLGMPKDLNGNGTNTDVLTADYTILPVRITIRWMSMGKRDTRIETTTFITNK